AALGADAAAIPPAELVPTEAVAGDPVPTEEPAAPTRSRSVEPEAPAPTTAPLPVPDAPTVEPRLSLNLPLLLVAAAAGIVLVFGLLFAVLIGIMRRNRRSPVRAPVRPSIASVPPQQLMPNAPAGAWGALNVVGGQARLARYPLAGAETLIGREDTCPVQLVGDASISRRHAIVRNDGRQIMVIDAGSTHGTYLNGQRIAGAVAVRRGMVIQVGQTLLRFE
ncbi:MAG TPA: FHA domain-containing protein, partial [Roseiflexaceae bacterium]|nr:FHA domain-containing protein [Roseiflexaceae bacterium]